uniref:Uncharacterized protein n=1 Tax=Timema cristinae TaxID=61476 RepID=A0A7R9GXE7_TIMCR|nr:unnamed protein product [Timema cristinae]
MATTMREGKVCDIIQILMAMKVTNSSFAGPALQTIWAPVNSVDAERFFRNHPSSPEQDSNLYLVILDRLVQHETSVSANYATKAGVAYMSEHVSTQPSPQCVFSGAIPSSREELVPDGATHTRENKFITIRHVATQSCLIPCSRSLERLLETDEPQNFSLVTLSWPVRPTRLILCLYSGCAQHRTSTRLILCLYSGCAQHRTSMRLILCLYSGRAQRARTHTHTHTHTHTPLIRPSHYGSISEDRECGSEMCMVRAAKQDVEESDNRFQIATLVWQKSKPPIGFSLSPPIVSARRAQVTRAHLQGELEGPLSLPVEPVISTHTTSKQGMGLLSRPLSRLDLMRSSAQVFCSCARSGTGAMRMQGRRDRMKTYENTENHPSTNVLFQSQSVFHSSKTSQTR